MTCQGKQTKMCGEIDFLSLMHRRNSWQAPRAALQRKRTFQSCYSSDTELLRIQTLNFSSTASKMQTSASVCRLFVPVRIFCCIRSTFINSNDQFHSCHSNGGRKTSQHEFRNFNWCVPLEQTFLLILISWLPSLPTFFAHIENQHHFPSWLISLQVRPFGPEKQIWNKWLCDDWQLYH